MPTKKKKTKGKKAKEDAPKSGGTSASASPAHAPRDPEEILLVFLHKVIQWMQNNLARMVDLFKKFDNDKDGRLSREDFIIGMRLLEAPLTKQEVDQLLKIIDEDGDGLIDILELGKIIREYYHKILREITAPAPGREPRSPVISLTFSPSRVSVKCPHCHIGIAEPPTEKNPRYVKLKVILAPFKDFQHHPGHFELEVTDSVTVHGLRILVKEHLENAVESIALFKDGSCDKSSYLVPSWSLERCGLVGGPQSDAPMVEVYYDYMPMVMDCPVLMTDSHIQSVPPETRRANHFDRKFAKIPAV